VGIRVGVGVGLGVAVGVRVGDGVGVGEGVSSSRPQAASTNRVNANTEDQDVIFCMVGNAA
jgi:hypothetical protein